MAEKMMFLNLLLNLFLSRLLIHTRGFTRLKFEISAVSRIQLYMAGFIKPAARGARRESFAPLFVNSAMAAPFSWIKPEPHGIYIPPADCWVDPSRAPLLISGSRLHLLQYHWTPKYDPAFDLDQQNSNLLPCSRIHNDPIIR